MPEEFKISKVDDFADWFIFHALSKLPEDLYNKVQKTPGMSVSLMMNGVELPVRETLETWHKHLGEFVHLKANQLIQEKLIDSGIWDSIDSLKDKIEEMATLPLTESKS